MNGNDDWFKSEVEKLEDQIAKEEINVLGFNTGFLKLLDRVQKGSVSKSSQAPPVQPVQAQRSVSPAR